MKRVLFLMGAYYPNAYANGICVGEIIKELQKDDCEVICVANRGHGLKHHEFLNGVEVFRENDVLPNRMAEAISRSDSAIYKTAMRNIKFIFDIIRLVLNIPVFPVGSYFRTNRIYRIAKRIVKTRKIDLIVGVNMPTDALNAAMKIKVNNPEISFVPYILDPIGGGLSNRLIKKRTVEKRSLLFEDKMLSLCDKAIIMKWYREYYLNHHKAHLEKCCFLDVPYLVERSGSASASSEKVIIYAGGLSEKTRNPEYIFKVFSCIKGVRLKMYLTGDTDWVKNKIKGIDNIEIHSRVTHDELTELMEKADGFLNIGNSQQLFVPSKLFEYFSYGKLVISTYRVENDTCLPYMEKYPNGLLIDEINDDPNEVAVKIEEKINDIKVLQYQELKEIFWENTPDASAQVIVGGFKDE